MNKRIKLIQKEAELLKKCIPLTKDALNISVNGGEALTPAQQYAMGNEIKNASQGSNGNYSVNFGEGGTTATVTNNNTGKTTTVEAKDTSQTNYSGVGNGNNNANNGAGNGNISNSGNQGNSNGNKNINVPSGYQGGALSPAQQQDMANQHKYAERNGDDFNTDWKSYEAVDSLVEMPKPDEGQTVEMIVEYTKNKGNKLRICFITRNADGTIDNSEGKTIIHEFNDVTNDIRPRTIGEDSPVKFGKYYYYPNQFPSSAVNNETTTPWEITGIETSNDMVTFGEFKIRTNAKCYVDTYDESGKNKLSSGVQEDSGYLIHTGDNEYTWGCLHMKDNTDLFNFAVICNDYMTTYGKNPLLYVY